jgi:hypothetical protein
MRQLGSTFGTPLRKDANPDTADPTTITLECTDCGAVFEHDVHKRSRRPGKCPACRGGSAGTRSAKPDRVVGEALVGKRCARCGGSFRPAETAVEIAGRWYHDDDACAGHIRREMAVAT